ncbi:MAG TPA: hemolysin family protein [Ktedonobacterales bacterium]|jgi:magnesium and cobalt exporter, CNNM family|nr:hemolysin family protein [Ktedonobacterales bacterium]
MEVATVLGILAIFVLVGANAFFVAAEFSLVKVRATRIEQLAEEGSAAAGVVRGQLTHLDNYIAATQLGITLASLALGWIGEPALAHLVEPIFAPFTGTVIADELARTLSIALSFALITSLHIVMGELVPKSVALQRTESVALFVGPPLLVFDRVFRPFIALLNGVGNRVVRLLGLQVAGEQASVHSVEELSMLVAQSREAGILDPAEESIVRHVFTFGDKTVEDAMTPRPEMVTLDVDASIAEAVIVARTSGYSRLPVYEGTLDQVVGMLYVKDLLQTPNHAHSENGDEVVDGPELGIRALLRPATFVPERLALSDVLDVFRRENTQLALAADEYGQTTGLITLEDVLEELVGEIHDEYDVDEDAPIMAREDGTWLVDGAETYDHVREAIPTLPPIPPSERGLYTTLSGLLAVRLDRIPRTGDSVAVGPKWIAEAVNVERRRVTKALLRPVPDAPQPSAGSEAPDEGSGPSDSAPSQA